MTPVDGRRARQARVGDQARRGEAPARELLLQAEREGDDGDPPVLAGDVMAVWQKDLLMFVHVMPMALRERKSR